MRSTKKILRITFIRCWNSLSKSTTSHQMLCLWLFIALINHCSLIYFFSTWQSSSSSWLISWRSKRTFDLICINIIVTKSDHQTSQLSNFYHLISRVILSDRDSKRKSPQLISLRIISTLTIRQQMRILLSTIIIHLITFSDVWKIHTIIKIIRRTLIDQNQ
jgi:hypothetical protein